MLETSLKILKKFLQIIGIIFIIVLNLYISHIIYDTIMEKAPRWFWDIETRLNELIYPPLHHFEWNTLKPNPIFDWYVWRVVKMLVRQSPIYIPLFLLGNIIVYTKRKNLPKLTNILMLPLNYIKVIILAYYLTRALTFPFLLLTLFEILQPEQIMAFPGPMYSHVFWLSIFFAWRQINLRGKPSKFHLPAFPKASPSPTL